MRGPDGNRRRRRRWPSALLAAGVAIPVLTGCSESGGDDPRPAAAPASAAVAPDTARPPAGTVTAAGSIAAVLSEPASGRIALLDPDGLTVRILDPGAPGTAGRDGDSALPARTLTLPARAHGWAAGAPGELLIAADRQLLHLDLVTAAVSSTPVDGEVRAVARRGDGSLAAALADGRALILDADGRVRDTVTGLSGSDAVAAAGDAVAVLDRDQTSLTQLALDRDRPGLALRAGQGATNLVADHFGRLLVTDTAGGALLVYTADPLVLRQRFPVGSSPYALAYDQRSDTVWVTLTGSNEVVGYDLSRGIPEEVGRFATVRQPNSVTIDDRTGEMFVGSATGAGLQRIGADQRKRGQ
ncbi:YncE family protein [Nocardia transvalensis]|uniref:YncE family protein n=1 Tax=Nocardia transvalensis TaxID=37333 RepID=UPI001895F752|nr:hypothetical protein [Nocardia transvalensis]MBF6328381.1 hypothetical protein [Nocardia transvalensis]